MRRNLLVSIGGVGSINAGNSMIETALLSSIAKIAVSPVPYSRWPLWELDALEDLAWDNVIATGAILYEPAFIRFVARLPSSACLWLIGVSCGWVEDVPWDIYQRAECRLRVGVRDPFTDSRWPRESVGLVGCPVLFHTLPRLVEPGLGTVVSQGRVPLPDLSRAGPRTFLEHGLNEVEEGEPSSRRIEYQKVKERGLALYGSARLVVTSRFHGALAALAAGVPLVFFNQADDPRNGLLEAIGVPVHDRDFGSRLLQTVHTPTLDGLTELSLVRCGVDLRYEMRDRYESLVTDLCCQALV